MILCLVQWLFLLPKVIRTKIITTKIVVNASLNGMWQHTIKYNNRRYEMIFLWTVSKLFLWSVSQTHISIEGNVIHLFDQYKLFFLGWQRLKRKRYQTRLNPVSRLKHSILFFNYIKCVEKVNKICCKSATILHSFII